MADDILSTVAPMRFATRAAPPSRMRRPARGRAELCSAVLFFSPHGRLVLGLHSMKVLIKPRLQKDKWSLYWKTSMATKTELLDPFELEVSPDDTAAALKAKVGNMLSWQPVDRLLRLEGFEEPWELCAMRGVELPDSATLESAGVTHGAEVTIVRKVLVAEGACTPGKRRA